jgi:hypothetical protein
MTRLTWIFHWVSQLVLGLSSLLWVAKLCLEMYGMIGNIIPSGIYIKLPHGDSLFKYLMIRAHTSALICSVNICCTRTSPASEPKITWHGSNWL